MDQGIKTLVVLLLIASSGWSLFGNRYRIITGLIALAAAVALLTL